MILLYTIFYIIASEHKSVRIKATGCDVCATQNKTIINQAPLASYFTCFAENVKSQASHAPKRQIPHLMRLPFGVRVSPLPITITCAASASTQGFERKPGMWASRRSSRQAKMVVTSAVYRVNQATTVPRRGYDAARGKHETWKLNPFGTSPL